MKKSLQYLKILFLAILCSNCSADKDSKNDAPYIPIGIVSTVKTSPADNVSGLSVTLHGEITSIGNYPITKYGFCVSTEINPDNSDLVYQTDGTTEGNYSRTVEVPDPNKLYHARAFAISNAGIAFGEDVTFTSGFPVDSFFVTNIATTTVLLRGSVISAPDASAVVGCCYNTSPNPTIANYNQVIAYGIGSFTFGLSLLLPNTTYYIRPYYSSGNQVFYGAELTFKTAGYFGPAGGYVAFDKGEFTDGWRYLEIYPEGIAYAGNLYLTWGCAGTFLSNTYPEIGSGVQNTQIIVNQCLLANCAARICDNYVKNGFSDWFLGSRDEMVVVSNSVRKIGINLGDMWTSSELLADQAYYVGFNSSLATYSYFSTSKTFTAKVFAIRRY